MTMETVKVRIFDTEYTLKGDDPALIYRCAEQVDRLMNELHKGRSDRPVLALAILTALNLAESLEAERKKSADPDGFAQSEVTRMIDFTGKLLQS